MQLFMHRRSLVRDLGRGRCLLLPSDPGQERMIELMRLFNPAARAASAGRISSDDRHITLTRPLRIDAETASRAQTPPGLSTVYFVQITVASPVLTPSAVAQGLKELRVIANLLIGGLAARLGGKALPESDRLREPLHADVYSPRAPTTGELSALLEPYAPGLAVGDHGSHGDPRNASQQRRASEHRRPGHRTPGQRTRRQSSGVQGSFLRHRLIPGLT